MAAEQIRKAFFFIVGGLLRTSVRHHHGSFDGRHSLQFAAGQSAAFENLYLEQKTASDIGCGARVRFGNR